MCGVCCTLLGDAIWLGLLTGLRWSGWPSLEGGEDGAVEVNNGRGKWSVAMEGERSPKIRKETVTQGNKLIIEYGGV